MNSFFANSNEENQFINDIVKIISKQRIHVSSIQPILQYLESERITTISTNDINVKIGKRLMKALVIYRL